MSIADSAKDDGRNVLVNYNYVLRVEGIYDVPCKAVHSFKKENEFEHVQEGGLNDYVHLLRKPISQPFSFTIERYVGTDPIPILPLGAELILPVILTIYPHQKRGNDADARVAKRTFIFTGCTVMSKTYGELNAERSGLLTEETVIGFREMMEVSIPVDEGKDAENWLTDKKQLALKSPNEDTVPAHRYWAMPGGTAMQSYTAMVEAEKEKAKKAEQEYQEDKSLAPQRSARGIQNKDGSYSRISPEETEADIAAGEARSRRWKFDGTEGGSGKRSVDGDRIAPQDATKAAGRQWLSMDDKGIVKYVGTASADKPKATGEAKKRKWKFDKTKVAGTGIRSAAYLDDGTKDKNRVDADADAAAGVKRARLWKFNGTEAGGGKRSVTGGRIAPQDATKAASRQWKFDGTEAGSGKRSVDGDRIAPQDATKAAGRQWKFDGTEAGGGKRSVDGDRIAPQDATKAASRQWKFDVTEAGGGKRSVDGDRIAPQDATKAASRQWKFDGTEAGGGKRSVDGDRIAPQDATKAAGRQWKFDGTEAGGGKRSVDGDRIAPQDATKAASRQWEFTEDADGKGTRSAAKAPGEDKKPKTRQWEFTENVNGKGTRSAVKAPEDDTKPKGRKWPTISSANSLKNQ